MSAQNLTEKREARLSSTAIPTRRILTGGLVAIVAAVAANLIARALLLAILDLPAGFPPLQPAAIIFFSVVGTALGVLAFIITSRLAKRPFRTYMIVAAVALVLSILPNLGLMANPSAGIFPGGTSLAYGVLIVFHFIAAVAFIGVLYRMVRE